MSKIDVQHADYMDLIPLWQTMRDTADGQEAIHAAGSFYLPPLSDQSPAEYQSYKKRALFYEATGRTIQGLKGMVFRKPPIVDDGGMSEFIKDVNLEGMGLSDFSKKITAECLTVARCAVLVDYPVFSDSGSLTVADIAGLNARPFFSFYKAESITNWKTGRVNNKTNLLQVRLFEKQFEAVSEFEDVAVEQYRILDLSLGIYRQRIFRKNKKNEWIQIGADIIPLMNGAPLNYIPIVFFSPDGGDVAPVKPPLLGLANVNISHYLTTADLEHGSHYTGLPTAWLAGLQGDEMNATYKIGGTTAWAFTNPDTKVNYLEFQGAGLSALEKRIQVKELMMGALGAQMLLPQENRMETAETASIRHIGENSVLSSLSQSITAGLNKCLSIAADWMGTEQATIIINTDFMPSSISPAMLQQLMTGWQSGAISGQTLHENLQHGEIVRSDKTYDDELADIQDGGMVLNAP